MAIFKRAECGLIALKTKKREQATEIYSREFDTVFFNLPAGVSSRVPAFQIQIPHCDTDAASL